MVMIFRVEAHHFDFLGQVHVEAVLHPFANSMLHACGGASGREASSSPWLRSRALIAGFLVVVEAGHISRSIITITIYYEKLRWERSMPRLGVIKIGTWYAISAHKPATTSGPESLCQHFPQICTDSTE